MERFNGQTVLARKPYVEVNWTKGIDQKTGKPLDYDSDQGRSRPMQASPTVTPGRAG